MTNNDCFKLFSDLDISWHTILGPCGNYYLGHLEKELALSLVTYKRICDLIYEELVSYGIPEEDIDDEMYRFAYEENIVTYDFRQIFEWNYVISRKNKLDAFLNTVEHINYFNYCNIPYGDKLIPEFHCSHEDVKPINQVLSKWMEILSDYNMNRNSVNDEQWLFISKRIRKNSLK